MKPISASQVKSYRECPRRWWYESVIGRRSPPTESMIAGTKLHTILEQYLKHGAWPAQPEWITIWNPARTTSRDVELVSLAKLGLPHLPPAGTATVEGRFTHHVGGIDYLGFIDLHHRREGVLALQDHKTSSDPRKYGLHEKADYLDDPQALLYARYLLDTTGDYSICLQWIYYATKGKPRVIATPVLLSRNEVEIAFASVVHKAATEMVQIRKKGVDAPPPMGNTDSCHSYGAKCPHYEYCKPDQGDTDMSSFDDFFATETPAPKAPAAFTKIAVPTTEVSRDLLADLQTEAPPFQTGDEYLKAQAKAAEAAAARDQALARVKGQPPDTSPGAKAELHRAAQGAAGALDAIDALVSKAPQAAKKAPKAKDPINPPEKPAGVGLEPQGIGNPAPAVAQAQADFKKTNAQGILLSIAELLTQIAGAMAIVVVLNGCFAGTYDPSLLDTPDADAGVEE